jgi:pimeloyl-ACP methyl ester carboxylesterase
VGPAAAEPPAAAEERPAVQGRGGMVGPPSHLTLEGGLVEYRWLPATGASSQALVLLHEGLGSMDLWRCFPEDLAASSGRSVLVWSRHGYGHSGPAPRPRRPTYMHDEALIVLPELLDRLRIESPVLVGHSDGASIALIHAGGSGRPVGGVVAIAPHVLVEDHTLAGIAAARDAYRSSDLPARLGRYHDDVDATFWGWNDVWLSAGFRAWNIEDYLPRITAPVLVIQGADDLYGTLEQVARIEAATAGPVRRLVVDSGGHAVHLVHPDLVTRAIIEWLTALG